MITNKIVIPFKEDRSYIQGSDLYNAMANHLAGKEIENVRFSSHEFIKVNYCILYSTNELSEIEDKLPLPAHFTCRIDHKDSFLFFDKDPSIDSPPISIPYDEDLIRKICHLENETISISKYSPFSFMETIVSMKKEMLTQLFPQAVGKWVFTKVDLHSQFEGRSDLKITIQHNMQFKLIKSSILHRSEKLGHLYFSLVKT